MNAMNLNQPSEMAARVAQLPAALQPFGEAIVAGLAGGKHSVRGLFGQTVAVVERRDDAIAVMALHKTLSSIEWARLSEFAQSVPVELQPIEL